jgi:hypothetical protein
MNQAQDKYGHTRKVLLVLLSILAVIPLAPLINRYIPPLVLGDWNLDLTVSIILAAALTFLTLRLFRFLLLPAVGLLILVLIYNQLTNGYGFGNMIRDYKSMVQNNWGKKEQKEIDLVLRPTFFDGPRNWSVKYSLESFDEYYPKYGSQVRLLSLFRHINSNFKYVSDSERDEYFATAKETIQNGLGGDCDDHTLLMVTCMKAIGAHCRMILTDGHLYPELLCGDEKQFEMMQQAVIHLFGNEAIDNMYYHEQNGQYWINLDYTARYPGGPYVSETAYAIITL